MHTYGLATNNWNQVIDQILINELRDFSCERKEYTCTWIARLVICRQACIAGH